MMSKTKEDIGRSDLQKNMMKKIIFRLDYQGVLNSSDIISVFNKKFNGLFGVLQTTFHNKVDFDMNNIEEMAETLSIPIKEIEKQEIYRFSSNKFGTDKLILDISKYFTTLSVECVDYRGIDDYLNFFSELTDFLFDVNEYIVIKRIGLRKIGGLIFDDVKEIYTCFEQKYFNFDFQDTEFNSIRNRYIDVLQHNANSPLINYVRSFETGKYYNEETKEETDAYQVLLDIDSYFSENILRNIGFEKGNIKQLLEETNNVHLFKLFKMSVTEEFLNKNCHE